jgi:glycosyltransferase involved in cell wall biosynthesis
MPKFVAYDVTRLATRVFSTTPNGIDRVDSTFARHFLGGPKAVCAGMMMTVLGPRLIGAAAARDITDGIAVHWGETENPSEDASLQRIKAWLRGDAAGVEAGQRIHKARSGRIIGVGKWIYRHGFPIGRSPAATLPNGAIYLNVSQYPLWISNYFHWLKTRPDVKAVFFIHDLLPLQWPEYFRPAEYQRHKTRLANLARFGTAAIVTTEVVRADLQSHLASLGRKDMPVLVAPVPVTPTFYQPEPVDPDLSAHPYFVLCGTIEPRKNHLMILHVWREILARDGASAPKLILIGARGWENENVVDLLDRCQALREHVIEVSGLSTPSLKRLLLGARALLMPSFAEGYGLPLVEALAAHVPVIASDIPVFREVGGSRFLALNPIDGLAWLEAIRAFTQSEPEQRRFAASRPADGGILEESSNSYFKKIGSFLDDL